MQNTISAFISFGHWNLLMLTILCWFFLLFVNYTVFAFYIVCFGGNITKKDKAKIERVIKRDTRRSRFTYDGFDLLHKNFRLKTIPSILKDKSHPLFTQIVISERSGMLISLKCNREHYLPSFLPSAVRILQEQFVR